MHDEFEPVKIGFLGAAFDGEGGGFDKIHRMAFDEAFEDGRLDRRVEIVLDPERGLPRGSARNAIDGFRRLVDAGCVGVAGAYSSDNAIAVAPYANEARVPLVSWCGTERFFGDYCFQLGNGDCGGDAALMASWLRRHGHRRVAVLNEVSPNGEEYFRFFRQECRYRDVAIGALETVTQHEADLTAAIARLRDSGCDALAYLGYGHLASNGRLRESLEAAHWDPPRIMTTAFMFYLLGLEKFEGWVGIDQYCPDNPLVEGFLHRYELRYGHLPPMWPNAIPLLAYDTARVLAEGLRRAPVLTGPGLKEGLEQLRFVASTTGGPRTHIACSPYDHKMFKGDWLLYGKVEGGRLLFQDTFRPD